VKNDDGNHASVDVLCHVLEAMTHASERVLVT